MLLPQNGKRAKAAVTTRNSSQSRNQLLAAMSAADFASLQRHLKPVPMALLKDMERPNQRIETVYFLETGIASVVAVQPDETRVEVGLIGREGMSGMAIVLGDDQSPHATYIYQSFHNFEVSVSGPENCDISARMATKFAWGRHLGMGAS